MDRCLFVRSAEQLCLRRKQDRKSDLFSRLRRSLARIYEAGFVAYFFFLLESHFENEMSLPLVSRL